MLYGRLGALVAAVVVSVVMSVALVAIKPAAADTTNATATTTDFRMTWGASITEGTITWYDRSVNIRGYVKAVSTTKQVEFVGFGSNGAVFCAPDPQTRTTSAGTSRSFNFGMYCDIVGGFDDFTVYFNDEIGNLLFQWCTRSGCTRPEFA